jgi:hypothetical protein
METEPTVKPLKKKPSKKRKFVPKPCYSDEAWLVSTIIDKWKTKTLVKPDFQRDFVWSIMWQKELIESFLIKKDPIPHVCLSWGEDKEGEEIFSIIDGFQRLTTIKRFRDNKFQITFENNPVFYKQLPDKIKRDFNSCIIRVTILKYYSEERIRELFLKLQNSKPLTTNNKVNALRNGVMDYLKTSSALNSLIEALTKRSIKCDHIVFKEATIVIVMYSIFWKRGEKLSSKFDEIKRQMQEIQSLNDSQIEFAEYTFASVSKMLSHFAFPFYISKSELVTLATIAMYNNDLSLKDSEIWEKFGIIMDQKFHYWRRPGYSIESPKCPENTVKFYSSMRSGGIGGTEKRVAILAPFLKLASESTKKSLLSPPSGSKNPNLSDTESTSDSETSSDSSSDDNKEKNLSNSKNAKASTGTTTLPKPVTNVLFSAKRPKFK